MLNTMPYQSVDDESLDAPDGIGHRHHAKDSASFRPGQV